MAGDVRGTFDLNDRPATAAMRRLRREGEELDLVLGKLGQTVDSIFSEKNVAEVKGYELALASLDRQARQSFNSISRNAKEAEFSTVGSIRRMDSSVALLRENLDSLSREKATPKINLKGFDESLAQVELLHKRVNALGREVATPRVGIPQSAFAAGTVSRVASGGSGSSGGGLFGNSLKIPFAGSVPAPLIAGALGAAAPLSGAVLGVGGSLGAAALGAGSIGLGAAGTGAAAIGMTAPIAISSIHGIKEASKALKSYREEVVKSGVNSEAARQKYRKYNMELKQAPVGTERLLRAKEGLVEDFRQSTKPAQAGFTGILTRGLNLGRQLNPLYSEQANQFFGAAQPQANQFAGFLNSGSSRQFYEAMGGEAAKSLRPTENIAENVTATLMNLTRSARPFFREGLGFLDRWTGGWRKSSKDISGVRNDMRGWVGDLKTWGKLTGATFELLKDLGSAGAGSGQSLVGDLTQQLEVWDQWIERNPRQVHAFFHESVESTERLAEAVGKITNLIWRIGQMLTPILTELSQFITFASNSGLLEPGMLPLLLAGGAGIRNVADGARTRILGGTAASTTATTEGLLLGGAVGGGGAARGAGLISRAGGFLSRMGTVGRVPVAGAGGSLAAEADAGLIGATRFSATKAAGYAGSELLGAGGAAGATFLRGFGARFLPFAALMGGLQFASYPGNFGEKTQAAGSALTAGFVPMPKTGNEEKDQGNQYAQQVAAYYAQRYSGHEPSQLQEQIDAIRRKRHRLLTPEGGRPNITIGESITSAIFGNPARQIAPSATSKAEAEALNKQLQQVRSERVSSASQSAISDLTGAYGIRARHGADPSDNYQRTLGAIEQRVGKMHGRTRREFAQMGLDWADEVAKANPKLKQAYNRMAEGIEERLKETGRQVAIINGNIVDTSTKSWNQVADQIGTATQRAYSEANKNLTALEKRALAILKQMGYSNTQAQSLMQEAQNGHPTKSGAAANVEAHHHGQAATTINNMPPTKGRNASGGRLPVPANGSERDDVYLGGGQYGAGNELVVPSHIERQVNRVLGRAGKTLGGMVAMNNRAHWQMPSASADFAAGGRRFATGGRVILDAGVNMGVGQEPKILGDLRRFSAEEGQPVYVISGYRSPAHSVSVGGFADDPHTRGEAADIGLGSPTLASMTGVSEAALKAVGLYRPFYPADPGEANHVQLLAGGPSGRSMRLGGVRHAAGRGRANINLQGIRSKQGGVPGAAATGANSTEAAALSKNLNRLIGRHGGGGHGAFAAPGGSRSAVERQIYRELSRHGANRVGAAGIIGNAYRESGMDPGAEGTGGGGLWGFTAGAISLANLKAAGGSHWESPVFQTDFMLAHGGQGLIPKLNRAGSAEAAAALFMNAWERPGIPAQSDREAGARVAFNQGFGRGGRTRGFAGWFKDGFRGRVSGPTLMGVGEAGAEDVTITPTPKRGRAGRGGEQPISVTVQMGNVTVHGSQDTEKVGKEIGRHAARELTKAMRESDGQRDGDLIGA